MHVSDETILSRSERELFWNRLLSREDNFQNEDTWVHAFNRLGIYIWIFLGLGFLFFVFKTQNLHVQIRAIGLVGALWALIFYVSISRFKRLRDIRNSFLSRTLSLQKITQSDISVIDNLFRKETDVLRKSLALTLLVLLIWLLIFASYHIKDILFNLYGIAIIGIIILLTAQTLFVYLPFYRDIQEERLRIENVRRVLSTFSLRHLIKILTMMIMLIALRGIVFLISALYRDYESDFGYVYSCFSFFFIISISFMSLCSLLKITFSGMAGMSYRERWQYITSSLLIVAVSSLVSAYFAVFIFSLVLSLFVLLSTPSADRQVFLLKVLLSILSGFFVIAGVLSFSYIGISHNILLGLFLGIVLTTLWDNLIGAWCMTKNREN